MAKVLFTAIVADMRNKLNGTVFSKNRYGAYTRTKVTPVNPQSDYQQEVRGRFGAMSAAWRGLTEGERLSWTTAAASFPVIDIFGNSKILSGQALFNQLNINLQQAGQAQITTAPAPVAIPSLVSVGAVADNSGLLEITGGLAAVPAGFTAVVFATPNYGAGISFVKNKFRLMSTVAAAATLNPYIGSSKYALRFGALVVSQKISVKMFLVSNTTGQSGVPFTATTTIGTP